MMGYSSFTADSGGLYIVASGLPITVFGFQLKTQLSGGVDLFDSQAAYDAGTAPILQYHPDDNQTQSIFIEKGVVFPGGLWVSGSANDDITVFYKRI